MTEDERFEVEQRALPEHLQQHYVFERPQLLGIARLVMALGLHGLGAWICGLRFETPEERLARIKRHWAREDQ